MTNGSGFGGSEFGSLVSLYRIKWNNHCNLGYWSPKKYFISSNEQSDFILYIALDLSIKIRTQVVAHRAMTEEPRRISPDAACSIESRWSR
jgi:hypothetical protein